MQYVPHPEAANPSRSHGHGCMSSGASVLIVDGDARLRNALNSNFLRHGWRVKTAAVLREAFLAMDQQTFNLVISDVKARDGDVYEVLAALGRSLPSTPVIVLAAHVSVAEAVQLMRAGVFDILTRDTCFDLLQASARDAVRSSGGELDAPGEVRSRDRLAQEDSPCPASGQTLSELNRKHLEDALAQAEGNRTNAAKTLGISVRTVRNKIRQYGLPPRSYA